MLRIRTFLFGTVLLCFTVLPLYGLDLIRELDWKDNGNLKVERKEDGGRMRLVFTLPKTEEPLKFINCTGFFSKVRDISDFKHRLCGRRSRSLRQRKTGGHPDFRKEPQQSIERAFEIRREKPD